MDASLYPMIFKRKSFHLFRNVGHEQLSSDELENLRSAWTTFEPLCSDIRTGIRIIPAEQCFFKRDAEYCVLIYSEKKPNYLMNAGYLGEQFDLYCVAHDIATLWYGVGHPDEPTFDGLDFVIMFAVRKVSDPSLYRKDMFKAKRRELAEYWEGDTPPFAGIARFAPSACNSQPWYVKNENGMLSVYRYKRPGVHGLISAALLTYFNRIDIGIYLCILELCIAADGLPVVRTLFTDDLEKNEEKTLTARYELG